MPAVTINLVTYNSAANIRHCLQSIRIQSYPNVELMVLDNASSDDTVGIVQHYAPDATIIREDRNTGFASAHNRIIRQSRSDYVLVLNDDCSLESNYIETLVHYMEKHPDAGSITGMLYRVSSLTDIHTRGSIDTLGLCISPSFHVANIGPREGKNFHPNEPISVFGVSATAALYRRKALEQCAIISEANTQEKQYFDEQFFIYKEDIDLAARLYRSGWNAYGIPAAVGYHIRSTAPKSFQRNAVWINQISYRNHLWFVFKNIARIDGLTVYLSVLSYEIVKFFYLVIREPRTLRALPNFFRGLPSIMKKRKIFFDHKLLRRPLRFSQCH